MQIDEYPAFTEILGDLQFVLKNEYHNLIWKKQKEDSPFRHDLSFHPVIPEKTVEKVYDKSLCTKCAKRISYKEQQFSKNLPVLPYLFLVHNKIKAKKDTFYSDQETNLLFYKIIESVLEKKPEDFLIREIVRCHFDQNELSNGKWIENCLAHVYEDIKKYNIKGIMVIGDAVKVLFNINSNLKNKTGIVTELFSLPAVLSSGPGKIIYMQKNNFSQKEIKEEKLKIFNAFSLFKKEIAHF